MSTKLFGKKSGWIGFIDEDAVIEELRPSVNPFAPTNPSSNFLKYHKRNVPYGVPFLYSDRPLFWFLMGAKSPPSALFYHEIRKARRSPPVADTGGR